MTKPEREVIDRACGLLGAAIVQSAPSDDTIIMDHVGEARALLQRLTFWARVEPALKAELAAPESRPGLPPTGGPCAEGLTEQGGTACECQRTKALELAMAHATHNSACASYRSDDPPCDCWYREALNALLVACPCEGMRREIVAADAEVDRLVEVVNECEAELAASQGRERALREAMVLAESWVVAGGAGGARASAIHQIDEALRLATPEGNK